MSDCDVISLWDLKICSKLAVLKGRRLAPKMPKVVDLSAVFSGKTGCLTSACCTRLSLRPVGLPFQIR